MVAAIDNQDGKGYRLHSINIKRPGPPKLVNVIPPNETSDGVAWSRDGKSMAFSTRNIAQPTEVVTGVRTD